ncbi:uncharacterized protein FFB20_15311 [Fusarium fujikuroi]|nr:uncharacterized protein FFE2_00889 [Fusarium fujikuroi]SCN70372.1 uncharacterized protein FFC1_00885 [Fusarium fujikuroi]SCN74151.1 uncharacterized protein FFM5_00847 [Fusarium fujikuroi]SCO17552.1 uncharacterized protein FFB20_15311 [Fusarium fujikuroi]SCO29367.1 uncharacterized protein FFNC_00886 [Fusarium fujikuroi]
MAGGPELRDATKDTI